MTNKRHDGTDFAPQVIIPDEIKKQMEQDPEMAKAMISFMEMAKNALQGVHDGRYKSFEDAMEAISGTRPQPMDMDDVPEEAREFLEAAQERADVEQNMFVHTIKADKAGDDD